MKEDIFAALAIVAALGFAALGLYRKGEHDADARNAAQLAAVNRVAHEEYDAAQRESAQRESALRSRVAELTATNETERANHDAEVANLRAAARAGAVRLSIPVAACANAAAGAAGNSAAAGPAREERRDVVPRIADDIFRVAGNAANDVRDFNELRDRYDAVVAACQ